MILKVLGLVKIPILHEELCKKKSSASVLEHLDLHKSTMKSYDPINRFAGTYSITLDCAETTGTSVQPMPGRQVIIVARSPKFNCSSTKNFKIWTNDTWSFRNIRFEVLSGLLYQYESQRTQVTRVLVRNRFIRLSLFHNNSKINEVAIIIGIVSQTKELSRDFYSGREYIAYCRGSYRSSLSDWVGSASSDPLTSKDFDFLFGIGI